MAQQQTENLNDINNEIGNDNNKNSGNVNLQNGTENKNSATGGGGGGVGGGGNGGSSRGNNLMNEKVKSPTNGNGGNVPGSNGPPGGNNNISENSMIMNHPYSGGGEPTGHLVGPPQPPGINENSAMNKEDPYIQQQHGGHMQPHQTHPNIHPPAGSQYVRYHGDPNDPYGGHPYHHPTHHIAHHRGMGGKPMIPPNRPPQRYIQQSGSAAGGASPGPGNVQNLPPQQQQQQGPTPTLNSLLQSHPPPTHRYPNSYDAQHHPQQQQQQQQQQPPLPPQQQQQQPGYGGPQQGWAPPPRPYSPQMGQPYRTPPPSNVARGPSPYPPPSQGPVTGYPPQQQQSGNVGAGGPPTQGGAPTGSSHYPPYPQRYPTPPGPGVGPNHRSPYPPHQYPDPNRSWAPSGPSPAGSPGPGGHPLPPPSPQQQHGPPQSPGHAPSPSPQPPQPAQSPHQFPSRPSQSSTPNNTDTDTGDPSGQNSNDSSSGGGTGLGTTPGTPNSQAMRPTPSPTGSSGSRSMSPAVGQQSVQMPPRPSSSHSQVPNQTQSSNNSSNNNSNSSSSCNNSNSNQNNQQPPSSLDPALASSSVRAPPSSVTSASGAGGAQPGSMTTAQGSYQPPPPPPSHMHGYKMGPSPQSGPQNMTPYPTQTQSQYSGGNYSPRPHYPGNYGPPPTGQPPNSNTMPPGPTQYGPGRPMSNPVSFPPYQQNWGPPGPQGGMIGNHVPGKGAPPPSSPGGSPRPLTYLKHHLQHKGGYSGAQSPTPPQVYGNGPGMHPPMAPPPHMGPPMGPTNMGPPSSAPQNQPLSSGPNSHSDGSIPPPHSDSSQDNGINSSNNASHPVTSIVTTGPDGTPLDEVSQQSTLSNASAASGEDPQCSTPKNRKNESYNQTHLAPPTASPGSHGPHEDFEMGSPSWPRTPASPVFNSHVPQETFRTSKKSDSLCKLYEMDDNPDRRGWLDKLLSFMEERRTPITACPTISKTPLDLFRLYLYVKERGGFVEVCKVTKSKTWKDIAGLLGIGASSSAAYTLRKHYTKNLLAYECHFDRGGIDPLPIIQQVEAGSKKKSTKAASVPSPGSSNSQDSFPAPGSSSASMDGYGGYPGNYPPGQAPSDYNSPTMQRPPSQTNTQTPHPGNAPPASGDNISVSNPFDDPVGPPRAPYQQGAPYPPVSRPQGAPYQGQQNYNQYGTPEQYPPQGPPGNYPPSQGQFPNQNRTIYPPYGPEPGPEPAAPPSTGAQPPPTTDPYRGYTGAPSPYSPPPRPYSQQPPPGPTQTQAPSAAPLSGATPPGAPPGTYPPPPAQPDYYNRPPDQISQNLNNKSINMNSQLARQLVAPMSPAKSSLYHHNSPQPRRHPDFTKDQQSYSPYPPRPPMYGAWPNNSNQYRIQYPPQGTPPQQWPAGQRPPGPPGPSQGPGPGQWDPNRYMNPNQSTYPPNQPSQQWNNMPPQPGVGPSSPLRPPQRGGKPFPMPQPQPGSKPIQGGGPFQASGLPPKRDIVFPNDSVEATTPVLYRRKRLCRGDVGQSDAWKIFMALRSGLLSESTWALDVLNILLFDDSSVHYFGLSHLPGLLNLLLDHFQKSLSDMFDTDCDNNTSTDETKTTTTIRATNIYIKSANCLNSNNNNSSMSNANLVNNINSISNCKIDEKEYVDLGSVMDIPKIEDRILVMQSANNYTFNTRKGLPVKIVSADDDIFVTDSIRQWDLDSNKNYHLLTSVGNDPWTYGHTTPEPHSYIMDCFKAEIINIPFTSIKYSKLKSNIKVNNITNNNNNKCSSNGDSINNSNSNNYNNTNIRAKLNNKMDANDDIKPSIIPLQTAVVQIGNPTTTTTTIHSSNNNSNSCISNINNNSNTSSSSSSTASSSNNSDNSNLIIKKEPMDSDCRHIDMELERIPNGPQISNDDENTTNSCDDIKSKLTPLDSKNLISKFEFDVNSSIIDPAATLKRRRMSDYEDECYTRDEASLYLVTESQDSLARRCVCLSNILRNLTFVPGNEAEFVKSSTFLSLLGKLLLLHHDHPVRTPKTRNYDREEDADFADSCSSLQGENEWWWDYLIQIRENMLVIAANISGQMDLSRYDEFITRPILDGLLHWAVCPSAHGQDSFPTCGNNSPLSPQRLALEALCKLCVTDANVDLVIATPPFTRLEKLCAVLTRHLCRNEDQVLREFSVNLLHYLAAADSAMSRTVAMQSPCISYLVAFIEQAEQTALGVANQHGINFLRENPDSMGTSLDMLRRAAGTLLHLAKHPDNRPLFMQQEQRLLGLVMSHILDQQVALIISRVLFQVSRGAGPLMTSELNTPFQPRPQPTSSNKPTAIVSS